ncbi:MAG: MtrB/PioB family outer membrane beta-barrel protein [Dissulfurispiraceae bacterium]
MKLRKLTLAIAFVLLPFASALAGDDAVTGGTFSGQLGATGEGAFVSGNDAKFSEYSDRKTSNGGLFGDVKLGYDSDDYWAKLRILDPGYHTQDWQLDGGKYGIFSVDAFTNEIVHNITYGALTPYSGIGTTHLTAPLNGSHLPSNTNPATWNSFDYTIQRNQYGGGIKLDAFNPFYANFSVSREDRTGLTPWSNGGFGGGSAGEVPAPVNYETTNYMGEIGYKAKPLFAAVTFTYGDFTNQNQTLLIDGEGPASGSVQSLMSLPPDNHFYKLGFKGAVELPLNSRFSVSVANSEDKSTFNLSPLLAFQNAIPAATTLASLNTTNFTGRKDIENYAFSLTSNPLRFLDIKLAYKYYSTDNKSTDVYQTTTTIATGASTTALIPLFDYKKNSYGADFGFKLPESFHLNASYAYIDTDRENRSDIPSTKDSIYSTELKWNGLDFLTPKIGYERLERIGQIGTPYALNSAAPSSNQNYPEFMTVDACTQHRDTYKIAVDSSPIETLNLGVAYKYKTSSFPDNFLGVQGEHTNEFEAYGDYLIWGVVKVNGYFDIDNNRQNLLYWVGASSITIPPPPTQAVTVSNYGWNSALRDDTYEFGVGADVYLVPKILTFRVQYDYVNSDGTQDFNFMYPGAIANVNTNASTNHGPIGTPDLNDIDSYHLSKLSCKLSYAISKSTTIAAGAIFESFKYNDYALSNPNYVYYLNSTYLTGAYANPSYNASIVFVSMAYKF